VAAQAASRSLADALREIASAHKARRHVRSHDVDAERQKFNPSSANFEAA